MKGLLCLIVLGMAVLSFSAGCTAAPAGDEPLERVDAWVAAAMKSQQVPGLAVGIVKGNEVVYLKGFGTAGPSGQAVTAQTPFRIASVSKSITALAVMQLAEKGLVDIEAPLVRYLPDFETADAAVSGTIKVWQLLNQTSGFSTEAGNRLNHIGGSMPLDELVRQMKDERLVSKPGGSFHYSNANYVLLAALVEQVSGLPYAQYVQQSIFQPLGMSRSAVQPGAMLQGEMARGHRLWFGFPAAMGAYEYTACLNNASTAEDMAHYLISLLNNGVYNGASLCSEDTIHLMKTPTVQMGRGTGYGMGLEVDGTRPYALIHHPGDGPGFAANIALMPGEGWGVVVLQNANWLGMEGSTGFIANGIVAILEGDDPPSPIASPGSLRLLFDGVYLVTLFFLVRSFLRLGRWRGRIAKAEGRALRRKLIPVIMLDVVMPVGMLLFIPKFFAADWAQGFLNAPDFSLMMVLISVSLLALGAVRLVMIVRQASLLNKDAVLTN